MNKRQLAYAHLRHGRIYAILEAEPVETLVARLVRSMPLRK